MALLKGPGSVELLDPKSITLDPGLDEESHRSWVEKFKEASLSNHDTVLDVGNRRGLPNEKHLKADAARKKAAEKQLSKWEALGYHSLSIADPVVPTESDMFSGRVLSSLFMGIAQILQEILHRIWRSSSGSSASHTSYRRIVAKEKMVVMLASG